MQTIRGLPQMFTQGLPHVSPALLIGLSRQSLNSGLSLSPIPLLPQHPNSNLLQSNGTAPTQNLYGDVLLNGPTYHIDFDGRL